MTYFKDANLTLTQLSACCGETASSFSQLAPETCTLVSCS
jgi:hypothetical protein